MNIVDSFLLIFGVNLEVLPTTAPELLIFIIRVFVGIGLVVACFNLVKDWIINIFGGKRF